MKALRGLLLPAMALLAGCDTVVMSPSGDMALQERDLIIYSVLLMLIIIVPVITLIVLFAWRYRASNKDAHYDPDWDHSTMLELLIWSAPLLIIIALGALTWVSTHKLDPFRPLDRIAEGKPVPADVKPLEVDVVAMDWKWLFIYPEQGIATVNDMAAPVDRPIQFKLTASSVMNSFFIPALAGQVYAMPNMQTQLQAVMNKPGDFEGFSANFSGDGFSEMKFTFHAVSDDAFAQWVAQAKGSSDALNRDAYVKLLAPSSSDPVHRYGSIDATLYQAILTNCVQPDSMSCMKSMNPPAAGVMKTGGDAGGMAAASMSHSQ
jgi:cytochrome o ubiquinol oxidase subunit II